MSGLPSLSGLGGSLGNLGKTFRMRQSPARQAPRTPGSPTPVVSAPYKFEHGIHVQHDKSTGRFIVRRHLLCLRVLLSQQTNTKGLPDVWHEAIPGASKEDLASTKYLNQSLVPPPVSKRSSR